MPNLLHLLPGTWFIICTNFPMWLKPGIYNPTFTYTPMERKGNFFLSDEVRYQKNGKTKTIKGYDYPDKSQTNKFVWRGKGLLAIAKSNWEVRLADENGQWAVIYFSKTLFTPEGVDIIGRAETLDSLTLADIQVKMSSDSLLKNHITSLQKLSRTRP